MSHLERWGQVLPENKKSHMYAYLNQIGAADLKKVRALMLDLSLPTIDDPNVEEYIERFKDINTYSPYAVLTEFMGQSPYWWHVREWVRFIIGYHKTIPDIEFNLHADFAKHFPHISREDDSRIAIVMDQNKAAADLHTTMKIGRYLSKQTDAPESVIPDISSRYANRDKTYHLEVARTPAEIQWVYENGPTSCMGKTIKQAAFNSRIHPVHAYATPDIAVLYVRDLENPNRVISRTTASNINHTWVRIFGNEGVIKALLDKEGWGHKQTHGLDDHRLLNIEQTIQENGVDVIKHIGPYIDCGQFPIYTDPRDDKYLIINPQSSELKTGKKIGGTERSYHGKGFMDSPPMMTCEFCSGEFNPADNSIRLYEHDEITVCRSCAASHMAYVHLADMDTVYVAPDRNPQLFEKKLIVNSYCDVNTDGETITDYEYETYTFLDEREYNASDLPKHYKTEEPMHYDSSIFVPSINGNATRSEVKGVQYTAEQYLLEDLVWLDNKRVYKGHVENGRFKYHTISKITIDEILRNLRTYYFGFSASTSSEELTITSVSKTEKAGHMLLQEAIQNKIPYCSDSGSYYQKSVDLDKELQVYIGFLPDDTDGLLFRTNTSARSKYINSDIMYRKLIYVARHPNLARNMPIKKKSAIQKKPKMDSFDLGAIASSGASTATDRTRWVGVRA